MFFSFRAAYKSLLFPKTQTPFLVFTDMALQCTISLGHDRSCAALGAKPASFYQVCLFASYPATDRSLLLWKNENRLQPFLHL